MSDVHQVVEAIAKLDPLHDLGYSWIVDSPEVSITIPNILYVTPSPLLNLLTRSMRANSASRLLPSSYGIRLCF